MKTAIYLENGVTQVVLTADGEWEKSVLAQLEGGELQVFRGKFYECAGGWFRQSLVEEHGQFTQQLRDPDSLMLRVNRTTRSTDAR